jgi:hypothetical protein
MRLHALASMSLRPTQCVLQYPLHNRNVAMAFKSYEGGVPRHTFGIAEILIVPGVAHAADALGSPCHLPVGILVCEWRTRVGD